MGGASFLRAGAASLVLVVAGLFWPVLLAASHAIAAPRHGLSTFGDLKYAPDFKSFDYVNPDAPKGGKISMIGSGGRTTFDSFNDHILKGDAAQGLELLFDTLMTRAQDEPDAVYGLIAESGDVAADGRSVTFKLRAAAKFADGAPVTAADVVFSLTTLKDKGHPRYSLSLKDVAGAEAIDPLTVRYTFTGELTRDLPGLVAELPVLSMAYYTARPFDQTSLEPPVASGPYKIADFKAGTFVTFQRRDDYWARDLPVNRGRHNFDTIRYEYFRDRTAEIQNLFNGNYDFREEFTSKDWATGYDVPPIKDGRMLRQTLADERPSGTQGFFLNLRRAKFADVRVRRALDLAFDFEWSNKNLFYGLYKRTTSYFENSDMKAEGPPGPQELALLEPFRDKLPPEVFSEPYLPPVTDGSGSDERRWLKAAGDLLDAAGWAVRDGRRFNAKGEPLEVEVLTFEQGFDRIIQPYIGRLNKIGVKADIRRVDPAQYQQRTKTFDFDVTVQRYALRLTPGVELGTYFGSQSAGIDGSFNLAGIKDPVVDALIDKAMQAKSRSDLVAATRAMDRVLRAQNYWVSHWYKAQHNLAFWNRFSWPAAKPKYDRGAPDTWWYDTTKAQAIKTN
jgi:microcin C transport system substrate-binding protein